MMFEIISIADLSQNLSFYFSTNDFAKKCNYFTEIFSDISLSKDMRGILNDLMKKLIFRDFKIRNEYI